MLPPTFGTFGKEIKAIKILLPHFRVDNTEILVIIITVNITIVIVLSVSDLEEVGETHGKSTNNKAGVVEEQS